MMSYPSTLACTRAEKWMALSKWAPSISNDQPWRVIAIETKETIKIRLCLKPELTKTAGLLDPSGGGAICSLGTLFETITLTAAADGYFLSSLSVKSPSEIHLGSIDSTFSRCEKKYSHEQFLQITQRRTYRGRMKKAALSKEHLAIPSIMTQEINSEDCLNLKIYTFTDQKQSIAALLAVLDRIRCQNSILFELLLKEINFSDNPSKTGLPVTTLGISLPALIFLKTVRFIPSLQKLFCYGFDRLFIYEGLSLPIKHSGALFYLSTPGHSFTDWFNLGRLLQRIWLQFSTQGVAFQPIGTPLWAYPVLNEIPCPHFSFKNRASIIELHKSLKNAFAIDLSHPGIFFRAGYPLRTIPESPRADIEIEPF